LFLVVAEDRQLSFDAPAAASVERTFLLCGLFHFCITMLAQEWTRPHGSVLAYGHRDWPMGSAARQRGSHRVFFSVTSGKT